MKSVVQNSKLSLLPTGFHLPIHVKVHKSDLAQKMLLSCGIKKKKSTGGSKVKRKEKTLSSGGGNVTMETREEAPGSPSKKIRAAQQYSACYTSSGTRVMHPGAKKNKKKRSRLYTVTHHMDALLTKAPRLFCVLCFFPKSLSCVSKGNEAGRLDRERNRPCDKSLCALG